MATSNIQAAFGSGSLFAIPEGSNPTPVKFGIIQDVTLDFSFDMTELHGQKQFAVKLARGKAKATWKCKAAQLKGKVINDIFFNGTSTALTQDLTALDELHNVSGVASNKTVTVTHADTFLGNILVDKSDVPLIPVPAATALTANHYHVANGVYEFHSSNASDSDAFTYLYLATITDEAVTVAGTPYQNTVAQGASFVADLGVKYAISGAPLLCVEAGDEVQGKYSFAPATGKYTFAAADEGLGVLISYTHRATATDEAHTIPASGTYTATVTNSATFTDDLGVKYASTGLQLTRVAGGAETTGSYSVIAGVYTFAAGDGGAALMFSYAYTASTGQMTTITNNLMGSGIYFEMVFNEIFEGNSVQIHLTRALANKWSFSTKLDDFTIPGWEGSFQADDNDVIGYISMTQE